MRSLLFLVRMVCAAALGQGMSTSTSANPIRKVVNLLQAMQKKVAEEGKKAEELHDKYMCYCKNSGSDLSSSITAAETKIPELQASIKADSGKKVQLEADLKRHQADREAAKTAMAEATSIREKEKAAFDKALAENTANLAATRKAVNAIETGMGGSFLQTADASIVRAFITTQQDMLTGDRQEVLAFLAGQQGDQYAPASGEITGILKTMVDEMAQDQKELIATEEEAVNTYQGLMASKQKEVAVLQQSIEAKLGRVGELGVSLATMKNELEDTSEALQGDQKFAGDLKKNCGERQEIHEKEMKVRAQETVALADTVKILNDDDALDLFKRTLPSASASLMQVQESSAAWRSRVRTALSEGRKHLKPSQRSRLDFILLALRGKKAGFEEVVKHIDDLVANLKTEQTDDDQKKEYCAVQFDQMDDRKKELTRSISDSETVIEESKESIATLTDEIKALNAGIVALDKAVSEATRQRKAENTEHKELMSSDTAAKELILFAKNRLQKFYNPSLHKAAPERELSRGDRIYENNGGDIPTEAPGGIADTGITALVQLTSHREAPAPPPEVTAAYTKKSTESGGVMAMMDLLVSDLDKEMTTAEVEEKDAQAEYEQTMADSAEKRREDTKSLTDKEAAKADLKSSLEQSMADKKSTSQELMDTNRYIANLHAECDWLLQYFDTRRTARADEMDALNNAKAVLSGADYSFLQRSASARSHKFLRRA